jgi:ABC-2 type transport system ATP-binding protein
MDAIAPTAAAASFEIRKLSYAYGRKSALTDVSFAVAPGRFTALLGPNGAGKTTLFSLALRLLQPPPGTVLIDGRELVETGAAALSPLGVVFQEATLDLDLTVRQNLAYFAALHGLSNADAKARMISALSGIGMDDVLDSRVRTLSGGQRRRIEIARALLHTPRILLLDEPTVGLDIPTRQAIVAHVHGLAARDRVTVLWATHLIDEIGGDDDVVVLHEGSVAASGPVVDVLRSTGTANLDEAYARLTAGSS